MTVRESEEHPAKYGSTSSTWILLLGSQTMAHQELLIGSRTSAGTVQWTLGMGTAAQITGQSTCNFYVSEILCFSLPGCN
jgi:hypothetical protein